MILTDSAWMLWDMSLCQLEWLIIFLARTNVYVMLLYGPARTSFYFGCATMDVLCFCIMFCRSLFIILSFPLVIVLSVLVRYTASDDLFDIFILLMTSLISSYFWWPLWYLHTSDDLFDIFILLMTSLIYSYFWWPLWYLHTSDDIFDIFILLMTSLISSNFWWPLWYLQTFIVV